MLDYSEYVELNEYNDIIDILNRTNHETTYEDVMSKEIKVLDTLNHVVRHYKDDVIKRSEFVNRGIAENISLFWLDMNLFIKELMDIENVFDLIPLMVKGERVIYFGMILILFAFILFFVQISK